MKRITWLLVAAFAAGCGGGPSPAPEIDRPLDPAALAAPAVLARARGDLPAVPGPGQRLDGDWVLSNGFLAAAVSALENPRGFPLSGGNLVAVVPAAGGVSGVRELFTYFDDTFPRQAVYDALAPEADSTAAVLVARGHDVENSDLVVTTRYRLEPGKPYLEIATTVANRGTDTLTAFELGDAVQWGRVEPFAPGPGAELRGTNATLPWMGAHAENAAFLIAGADSVYGPQGGSWSDLIYAAPDLAPGASVTYRRMLYAVRGSLVEADRRRRTLQGDPAPAILEVRVRDAAGNGLAGAVVEARRGDRVELASRTDASGDAALGLPAGTYRVDATLPQRGGAFTTGVKLENGKTARRELVMSAPVRVTLRAVVTGGAASPARWTILGRDGTPDPRLGPEWSNPGSNTAFTPEGQGKIALPAGTYRVIASRGPAWEVWDSEVTLASGDSTTWSAALTPVPGAEAWQAADLHVHAVPSPDSNVSLEDRLASAAGAGLDWIVSADHGARTAYPADGRNPVGVIVGEEVTTPTRGHFTGFPLPPAAASPVDRRGEVPDIVTTLRADTPQGLIMINHPRSRGDGYFARLESSGVETPLTEATAAFDLIEIANGKRPDETDRVLQDWFALLRDGSRLVGVGNSDCHGLADDAPGNPRTLVATGSHEADSLISGLRDGRVVVTNGPYIRASIAGRGPGGIVELSGHEAVLDLDVFAAGWIDVSRVTVLVNGVVEKVFPIRERNRTVRFSEPVPLLLSGSSFVQVRVDGASFRVPAVPGPDVKPFAVTDPIWVEIPGASR